MTTVPLSRGVLYNSDKVPLTMLIPNTAAVIYRFLRSDFFQGLSFICIYKTGS
ncbi:MAG: hypothetical protein HJJLKODD_02410 [Phycisphaerae bacterium]|nr:hypothetical protein [Phycisphaerae bacterium]